MTDQTGMTDLNDTTGQTGMTDLKDMIGQIDMTDRIATIIAVHTIVTITVLPKIGTEIGIVIRTTIMSIAGIAKAPISITLPDRDIQTNNGITNNNALIAPVRISKITITAVAVLPVRISNSNPMVAIKDIKVDTRDIKVDTKDIRVVGITNRIILRINALTMAAVAVKTTRMYADNHREIIEIIPEKTMDSGLTS